MLDKVCKSYVRLNGIAFSIALLWWILYLWSDMPTCILAMLVCDAYLWCCLRRARIQTETYVIRKYTDMDCPFFGSYKEAVMAQAESRKDTALLETIRQRKISVAICLLLNIAFAILLLRASGKIQFIK